MAMNFEELDEITRGYMLTEFEAELNGPKPYVGKNLSAAGRNAFPNLLRDAIKQGDETTLATRHDDSALWQPTEEYERKGKTHTRNVNVAQAAERLAVSEFNTWYVRGLAKRLIAEGVEKCQAYRAAQPKWEPGDCSSHEGQLFDVNEIYRNHRARYWPTPNDLAVSIPFSPGCHHTIRRA